MTAQRRVSFVAGVGLAITLAACHASNDSTQSSSDMPTVNAHRDLGNAPQSDMNITSPGGDAAVDTTPQPEPTSLGAEPLPAGGVKFSVWAPNADSAFVAGTFNGFSLTADPLTSDGNGNFVGTSTTAKVGDEYRFVLSHAGMTISRNDTRGREASTMTSGSSIIVDPRAMTMSAFTAPAPDAQIVYELHLGTFNRSAPSTPGTFVTAMAKLDHLAALGINMIEIMPVHEFNGKTTWGYNPALPFAVARNYGTPDEMRAFVAAAHAHGIGVIVDVVHNHYNSKSLQCYDGECPTATPNGVYFYGMGDDATTPWGPRPNYDSANVRQYVQDNAMMWLDEYGCDGLRWDSVSYMRATSTGGTPIPNGALMLAATQDALHAKFPHALLIAEDFQTVDLVTAPTSSAGGLGFDAQWDAAFFHPIEDNSIPTSDSDRNMGTLSDALNHRYNNRALSRIVYSESHDEVANGRSRIPEMISPGDAGSLVARKRSTLAATLVLTAPGVPMLFMGQEFLTNGSFSDTNPLDWSFATTYAGILQMYTDLVHLRLNSDGHTAGLRGDTVNVFHVNDGAKVIVYERKQSGGVNDDTIVMANFSATAFASYDIGLPAAGTWQVRLNTDDKKYGSDFGGTTQTSVQTTATARDGFAQKATVTLPAYSAIILSQ